MSDCNMSINQSRCAQHQQDPMGEERMEMDNSNLPAVLELVPWL